MDTSEIVESAFRDFLGPDNSYWNVYKYGVTEDTFSGLPRGTCTTRHSDDIKTVLQRTREALREGFGEFNIVGSNCEDFALYCKTGQRSQTSGQYLSAMRRIQAARQAAAIGYKSPIVYAGCVLGWFSANDFGSQGNPDNSEAESTKKQEVNEVPLNTAL